MTHISNQDLKLLKERWDIKDDLIWIKTATQRSGSMWKRQYWYRLNKTDAVVFEETPTGEMKCLKKPNYFNTCKDYGERCKEVAAMTKIDIETILAIGLENEPYLPREIFLNSTVEAIHELLNCGIQRRKNRLKQLLGEENFKRFNVANMGQLNSKRLASYIAKILKTPPKVQVGAAVSI